MPAKVGTQGRPSTALAALGPRFRGGDGRRGVPADDPADPFAARRRGHRMKRRELLALIGGAAALAPFGATAQQKMPVIGYLSQRSATAETPLRTPFLE